MQYLLSDNSLCWGIWDMPKDTADGTEFEPLYFTVL